MIGNTININNASNVTIDGGGATIIGSPSAESIAVSYSSDLKIKNLNFDYDTPVSCRAKATVRQSSELLGSEDIIIFEVPEWYTKAIEDFGDAAYPSVFYAIPANGQRNHAYIDAIEKVDDTHCKVTFRDYSANGWYIVRTEEELATETDDRCTAYVDLPTLGYSHTNNNLFTIKNNSGTVEFENCNIWNAAQFVYQIVGNTAEVKLTNVSLSPKTLDACPTVAWRDVVHAKDNRAAITVVDCSFKGTHDDLFNITNTQLRVDEVDGTTLTLYGLDYSGSYQNIVVGDTLVAVNPTTDKYYGEAKVAEVIVQSGSNIQIKLDKDIGIEQGAYVYFKEWACPGTSITGGNYNGTVRIRAEGATITNANFDIIGLWTWYDSSGHEGMIPKDITYKNCNFDSAIENDSGTRITFKCTLADGSIAQSFAVENIVFDGCTFAYENIIDRTNSGVTIQ